METSYITTVNSDLCNSFRALLTDEIAILCRTFDYVSGITKLLSLTTLFLTLILSLFRQAILLLPLLFIKDMNWNSS